MQSHQEKRALYATVWSSGEILFMPWLVQLALLILSLKADGSWPVCVFFLHPDGDVKDKLPFQWQKMLLGKILLQKSLCNYYRNVRKSWITWVFLKVGDIWIFTCPSWDCTTLLMLVSLSPPFSSLPPGSGLSHVSVVTCLLYVMIIRRNTSFTSQYFRWGGESDTLSQWLQSLNSTFIT